MNHWRHFVHYSGDVGAAAWQDSPQLGRAQLCAPQIDGSKHFRLPLFLSDFYY